MGLQEDAMQTAPRPARSARLAARVSFVAVACALLLPPAGQAGDWQHGRDRDRPSDGGPPWDRHGGGGHGPPHDPPEPPGPMVLRETVVEIPAERLRDWANAKCGEPLVLPWFDGEELVASAGESEEGGDSILVSGSVEASIIGSLFLNVGKERVVGAITMDSDHYRLYPLPDGGHRLVQVNVERFARNVGDAIGFGRAPQGRREPPFSLRNERRFLTRVAASDVLEILGFQLQRVPVLPVGIRKQEVDVVIAYTSDVEAWEQREGLDLQSEITTMVGKTNLAMAQSGVTWRLRLVGTFDVGDRPVFEPAELGIDVGQLRNRFGDNFGLAQFRDEVGADLVTLLVLNGPEGCRADDGVDRACGVGYVPGRFPVPGEVPGTTDWEENFASWGFSVVDVTAGFAAWTYLHEIGHNLGAQHDAYTFHVLDGGAFPPADVFARGWNIFPQPNEGDDEVSRDARPVMAYRDLCQAAGRECKQLPVFSNPLQSWFGARRGDPAPGQSPLLLGPADNKSAINRMAPFVSLYRLGPSPP